MKILKPIRRQWDWTIGLSAKFYHVPFWFEPLFGKNIDWKSITCHHPLFKCKNCHQLSCGIWTCPNYIIVDDCRWWSMTVHNYLYSNMCDSWNHQLSWLFEWAFRNKIFVANVFGGSCKIKSFYKPLVSSFKSTSTDEICLCFLLGTLMGVLLLESLICHPPYGEDTVNLSCWEIIS